MESVGPALVEICIYLHFTIPSPFLLNLDISVSLSIEILISIVFISNILKPRGQSYARPKIKHISATFKKCTKTESKAY